VATPNPIKVDPFGKSPEEIIKCRNTTCVHYGGCLDQAFSKNWKGFSCKKCKVFEGEDLFKSVTDRSHRDHEADGIYMQF
jgi:hypothetical protein